MRCQWPIRNVCWLHTSTRLTSLVTSKLVGMKSLDCNMLAKAARLEASLSVGMCMCPPVMMQSKA
jgi:hypothetical protein